MTKKEKLNVAVAALEALLTRQGIYWDYFSAWHRSHPCNYGDTLRQCWIRWIDVREPHKWISRAFPWEDNNIPYQVWRDMNNKWVKWVNENLNN